VSFRRPPLSTDEQLADIYERLRRAETTIASIPKALLSPSVGTALATTAYRPGTTAILTATFRDAANNLDDAAPVTFDLVRPDGSSFLAGGTPAHDSTGTYHYSWAIPLSVPTGLWTIVWHGTIAGEPVTASESFLVG